VELERMSLAEFLIADVPFATLIKPLADVSEDDIAPVEALVAQYKRSSADAAPVAAA
jgi:hypothetical protein